MQSKTDLNLEFYQELYLIRRSEEKIIKHYFEDEMKTPMHMSMGSEAISVGLTKALQADDQVFGTYRSHALFLSKTHDTDDFFAEMYGKGAASLKGKGGSMHLCSPSYGFMGTSAIVASAIPVAVGSAFANKQANNGKTVAVFFGDGAIDEGVFWESLNAASLMKLPIIFVCEDNDLAVHTPANARHGYESITRIVEKFDCMVYEEKTTDVEKIYNLARKAIDNVNKLRVPAFLRLHYCRYLEHVGVCEDFDAGYRSRTEFEEWKKNDPIVLQRNKLVDLGVDLGVIEELEREVDCKVNGSFEKAKEGGFCEASELYEGVLG